MRENLIYLKANSNKRTPADILADRNVSVGTGWVTQTKDLTRGGLSRELQKTLLEDVLGIGANDPMYAVKARDFFASLDIFPGEYNMSVDDNDYPIAPLDYIKGCILKQQVAAGVRIAPDKETAEAFYYNYDFYIEDLQVIKKTKQDSLKKRQEIGKLFLDLTYNIDSTNKKAVDKIDWVLEATADKHKEGFRSLELMDKVALLEKVSIHHADAFKETVTDENLELRALILECVTQEVLKKVGNTYFYMDLPLGEMAEAIAHLKDAKNSGNLLKFKAALVEAKKGANK